MAESSHEYLGGTVEGLKGFPEGVGGMADHVHPLVGLKATHCLADFMRELKKASSAWVHEEIGMQRFAWQEGYAAFTVSPSARSEVQSYIARQEVHHRNRTFREELVEFLKKLELNMILAIWIEHCPLVRIDACDPFRVAMFFWSIPVVEHAGSTTG